MKTKKRQWHTLEIEHYKGSLDFPCDFCNSNSYDNLHIMKDNDLIVICWECINKLKGEG